MVSKRTILVLGIVGCLSFLPSMVMNLHAADTTSQTIAHVDEILQENPLRAGEESQMIGFAQGDTVTVIVVTLIEGFGGKPHFHETHAEAAYIVKGTGQMLMNDKWVDDKPGSLHFNPTGKVHAAKNAGNEPLVYISILTPAMKELDTHFVR